jgi:hypothetical protein
MMLQVFDAVAISFFLFDSISKRTLLEVDNMIYIVVTSDAVSGVVHHVGIRTFSGQVSLTNATPLAVNDLSKIPPPRSYCNLSTWVGRPKKKKQGP